MRILHVFHNADLVNGVDRTTLTLVQALQRIGVDVEALVPREGDVTRALAQLGVRYVVSDLPCCRGPAKMADLAYLARAAERADEIEKQLIRNGIDLIHLNTGHLIDGALAAARAGVSVIWHIHSPFEIDLQRYSGFMKPEGYPWLLGQLGSRVIAVSNDVRDSLLEWLPADKVSTLYNGIDVEDLHRRARVKQTQIREELGLRRDSPLILGVGRITAQKDFAAFVRVAEEVSRAHSTACFVIAGPAEDKTLAQGLHRQVRERQLERRVFIVGPRNDVPALFAQCDVFLSTARFEGHPLTALEAMAMGKPVVAMSCVGLRECIRHETDGLLVPLGDENACAEAVLRVLQSRETAAILGEHARHTVLDRYSASAYASGFLSIAERTRAQPRAETLKGGASVALALLCELRDAHAMLTRMREPPLSLAGRARAMLSGLARRLR